MCVCVCVCVSVWRVYHAIRGEETIGPSGLWSPPTHQREPLHDSIHEILFPARHFLLASTSNYSDSQIISRE
jgi:hypothetical protein